MKFTGLTKEEFLKVDDELRTKYHQFTFLRNPRLICPHCGKMFRHERMWQLIVAKFGSIYEIAERMRLPWGIIRLMVRKYGLELTVKGTADRHQLEKLAKRAGYFDLEDMVFDLRVRRGYNIKKIGELLGIDKNISRVLVTGILQPRRRMGIKQFRQKFGDYRYQGDIKHIELELEEFRQSRQMRDDRMMKRIKSKPKPQEEEEE